MFATLLNTQTYINKLSHQGLYLCVCGFLYYVLVFFSLDNLDFNKRGSFSSLTFTHDNLQRIKKYKTFPQP